MTSKQRSHLKSIAANLDPIFQLGKGGISENMVKSISDALEARELIKINVLTNAEEDARSLAAELAVTLRAECVAVIGRKVILYRRSSRKDFKHIEF
ncbi:MAG TPA: ribosome assembly RNA-binding protein YhbY [Candidatus Borkfalkia faecipullorum]|uniref:Ribosome assembly RNA-binding protein YhbY n=1 Tax=Candidatus Borkfalkia faecipullorum TaxID=2838510 RepID=A0A9D2AGY7_9FIRM|nr:ribosome assembly RNA-binding protein YhbY [Candidatus Borkfalkia faecipullorum]